MGELRNKTVRGTVWSAVERLSVYGATFVVNIVMARLLTPGEYGVVGLLAVFIAVAQSLVDCGFSQALIRKQDRTETDTSTVFWFNIAVGAVLYGVLCAGAPWISAFYHDAAMAPLVRVLSLGVLINSLVVVQRALLTVRIDFKTQAKASFTAAVVSGGLGIGLALAGFGVWAMVWQQLCNYGLNALLLWVLSRWHPRAVFSWSSFRSLFGFGSRLAAAGIIDTLYRNGWPLLLGRFYGAADTGYYTRAHQFSDFPSSNITGILQRVTYPVMCSIGDDRARLRDVYRRFLRLSAFVVFTLMAGVASVAGPLVELLLGPRWGMCGVILPVLCLQMMWYPVHSINLNLLQVKGRSNLFLRLEVYKKTIGVGILFATAPFGLVTMCWGGVATSLIALFINTRYTGALIGLGFLAQMRDLLPALGYSLSMWGVVWAVTKVVGPPPLLQLGAGIAAGVAYMAMATRLTGSREVGEVLAVVRQHRQKGAPSDRKP